MAGVVGVGAYTNNLFAEVPSAQEPDQLPRRVFQPICRGATVATALDAGALSAADALWQWLELPLVVQFHFAEAFAKSLPPAKCIAPPISGRMVQLRLPCPGTVEESRREQQNC